MHFADTVGEVHGSKWVKSVINISLGGTSKVSYPNKFKWLVRGILSGLVWVFLTLLDIGAALLQYFLPPGPNWFKIHYYCNRINFFFAITSFALVVHVLEKYGRKYVSFKHASLGPAILILVVFQVLASFNRPHIPPPP